MLSIVIPTHNRFESLLRLINSIEDSFTFGENLLANVIIVDDGSTDLTHNFKSENKNITIIHIPNGGPANARNAGFNQVQTDYVLFLDDDCVVTKEYAKSIFIHICENKFDVISSPAFSLESKKLISKYLNEIKFLHKPNFDSDGNFSCIPSSNLLVRSFVYRDIGGFNRNFENPGGEDDSFTKAALTHGYSLCFDEKMNIFHDNNITFFSLVKKYYHYGKGNAINLYISGITNRAPIFWAKSLTFLITRFPFFIKFTQTEQYKEFSSSNYYHRFIFRILSFSRLLSFEIGGLVRIKKSKNINI